jgi:hypothetical protein
MIYDDKDKTVSRTIALEVLAEMASNFRQEQAQAAIDKAKKHWASLNVQAPVQISEDWWMAMPASGQPYYHNTTTSETTWVAPMLSTESNLAATSTNSTSSRDPCSSA